MDSSRECGWLPAQAWSDVFNLHKQVWCASDQVHASRWTLPTLSTTHFRLKSSLGLGPDEWLWEDKTNVSQHLGLQSIRFSPTPALGFILSCRWGLLELPGVSLCICHPQKDWFYRAGWTYEGGGIVNTSGGLSGALCEQLDLTIRVYLIWGWILHKASLLMEGKGGRANLFVTLCKIAHLCSFHYWRLQTKSIPKTMLACWTKGTFSLLQAP